MIQIRVKKVSQEAQLPFYASQGASGADLFAFLDEPVHLLPGQYALIPTGLVFEIPEGWEIQVRPRSGLALKQGVTVLNAPGTIDSDYRGELKVLLINHGTESFVVEPKMRMAQMVFMPVGRALFEEVKELSSTNRAEQGFGSTGIHP